MKFLVVSKERLVSVWCLSSFLVHIWLNKIGCLINL